MVVKIKLENAINFLNVYRQLGGDDYEANVMLEAVVDAIRDGEEYVDAERWFFYEEE